MDEATYRESFFVDPPPPQRFDFLGIRGADLYFTTYEAAVEFYTAVLGPPMYVEGAGTRGWKVGNSELTLLKGGTGAPLNASVPFVMQSPAEAERLHAAFIDAGASGPAPSDQLMYESVRFCPVVDPFGTEILIYAPLP